MHGFCEVKLSFHALIISFIDYIVNTINKLLFLSKLYVGASLDVMDRDAKKMRGDRPFVFSNLKTGLGLETIVEFIVNIGMLNEHK